MVDPVFAFMNINLIQGDLQRSLVESSCHSFTLVEIVLTSDSPTAAQRRLSRHPS